MATAQDSKNDNNSAYNHAKAWGIVMSRVARSFDLSYTTVRYHLERGNLEHPAVQECIRFCNYLDAYTPGLERRGYHYQETNTEQRGRHKKGTVSTSTED